MNVEQLRKRTERELRHAPGVKGWRDEFVDRLNDACEELMTSENWAFRQRHFPLRLKAEVSLTSSDYTSNAGGNSFAVSFSTPSAWTTTLDAALLEGQTASFSGTGASDLNQDYVIEKTTESGGTITMILDPRYAHTLLSGSETLKLKFFRYRLPEDIEDVFDIKFRDDDLGKIRELSLANEADLILNDDDSASTPKWFMLDPNRESGYPFNPFTADGTTEQYPHDFIPAPVNAPTLTGGQAPGGDLTSLGTYEVRYCWSYAGMISAPSPTASITLTGSDDQIDISDMEVTDANRGRDKIVFHREIYADREGPWYVGPTVTASDTATASITKIMPRSQDPTATIREREFNEDGVARWVRTWPLTDTDYVAQLRYLAKIPRLEHPADVPQFPSSYHIILVHMVCFKLAMASKATDIATYHAAQAEGILKTMRLRHLGSSSTRNQRIGMLRHHAPGIVLQPVSYTSDG